MMNLWFGLVFAAVLGVYVRGGERRWR
jgi:hypothetical protein